MVNERKSFDDRCSAARLRGTTIVAARKKRTMLDTMADEAIHGDPGTQPPAASTSAFFLAGALVACLLPETRGKSLDDQP